MDMNAYCKQTMDLISDAMIWLIGHTYSNVLFVSLLLLCSCSVNKSYVEDGVIKYSLNDFKSVKINNNAGTLVSDDVSFGRSAFIKAVNDSIIAVKLTRSPEQVILHNLNSGKNQTAVITGKGPLEMLRVATMSITADGDLMLVGSRDKKVMRTHWNDSDTIGMTKFECFLPEDVMNGVSANSGKVIGIPFFLDNTRAIITTPNDSSYITFGSFPSIEMPDSVKANNSIFQSDIAYSYKNNCAILTNKSWNIIELYNLENGVSKTLVGPDEINARIIEKKIPNGRYFQQDPFWIYFKCVSAGPDTFSVGYIGTKVKKEDDFEKKINRILEFDYSGKPLRCFSFDHDIDAFDIDYSNRIIYTIEEKDDPLIMKYTLPD